MYSTASSLASGARLSSSIWRCGKRTVN